MNNIIYYFTGTGNSLSVAKDIKESLGETEIKEITYSKEAVKIEALTIGLVFPVYCWGLPSIVCDFIKRIETNKDAYIYSVATYGGMLGATNMQLKDLLNKNNLNLSAGFSIKMPGNYIPMYEILSEEKQSELFENKKDKVNKIVDIVKQKVESKIETSMGIFGRFLLKNVYPKAMDSMKCFDKTFTVDESCISCGICEKVCPKKSINIVSKKPLWKNDCEGCLACVHWCPQKSIQSGEKTKNRKRYHNPSITLQEISRR